MHVCATGRNQAMVQNAQQSLSLTWKQKNLNQTKNKPNMAMTIRTRRTIAATAQDPPSPLQTPQLSTYPSTISPSFAGHRALFNTGALCQFALLSAWQPSRESLHIHARAPEIELVKERLDRAVVLFPVLRALFRLSLAVIRLRNSLCGVICGISLKQKVLDMVWWPITKAW
jgi:hypothetical protein